MRTPPSQRPYRGALLTYEVSAPESTDSNIRYAAYASRIRTALISAQRYVAYTSDIGESFRPIAHPNLVRTAYGISWAYLVGDVGHEGYKAYCRNQRILHPVKFAESLNKEAGAQLHDVTQLSPGVVPALEDYRTIMVQRALFQGIASMGLPAFTIHSIVRYSTRALKSAKSSTVRAYVPIGVRNETSLSGTLLTRTHSLDLQLFPFYHSCSTNL